MHHAVLDFNRIGSDWTGAALERGAGGGGGRRADLGGGGRARYTIIAMSSNSL